MCRIEFKKCEAAGNGSREVIAHRIFIYLICLFIFALKNKATESNFFRQYSSSGCKKSNNYSKCKKFILCF